MSDFVKALRGTGRAVRMAAAKAGFTKTTTSTAAAVATAADSEPGTAATATATATQQASSPSINAHNFALPVELPNIVFLVSTGDEPVCDGMRPEERLNSSLCSLPMLTISRKVQGEAILVPSMTTEDMLEDEQAGKMQEHGYTWQQKLQRAVFRCVLESLFCDCVSVHSECASSLS